jgi:cytochrome b6-f complex iron-sulfur subunit
MADTPITNSPPPEDAARGVSRRRFLNATWKTLGVVLIGEGAWTSYDILNARAAGGFGGVVDAGPVGDYMAEETVQYFLDGRFYVTQYQGGLRALYQKCPHLGCRVPFCDSSSRFECPCHGSVYNIVGEYIQGPAPRGMDRFHIALRNGRVMVDTSTVIEGPPRGELSGPREAAGPSCVSGAEGSSASQTPTSSMMPMEGSS